MKAGLLHVFTWRVAACLIALAVGIAQAGEVVVPTSLENVEGNQGNVFPFGLGISYRYQQVYAATEFDPSEPLLITEIRFRPDFVSGGSFSTVLPDVQINMSTTGNAPDLLSSAFADNVGADDTIVFDGALPLSSNATGPGPFDFDVVITLSTPFLYDPLEGDLLLDVRNFGGGGVVRPLDAHAVVNDPISRVTTNFIAGDVDSAFATLNDSWGLVTRFIYEAAAIAVVIDVRPGSDENPVNLAAPGKLPVAVLSTDDFDATSTDTDQPILLGDPDLPGAVSPTLVSLRDVDGDGDLDLMLHFSVSELVEATAIDADTQFLGLTAETLDGTAIGGLDLVTIISR